MMLPDGKQMDARGDSIMTSYSGMDVVGLIAVLQGVQAKHGNIEVRIDGEDWVGSGFIHGWPDEFPDYFEINV